MTQIKRSAGQSAVAAAAYRAGEKLHSAYYGEDSDYTRKGGVIYSEILLPSHALPEYTQTAKRSGMRLKKPNAERKHSLPTALTLPCRTSFPCRRTSILQGNFCWSSL